MASESKARLIEAANRLRRDAERERHANLDRFRTMVLNLSADLTRAGLPLAEVKELLPDTLLDDLPACRLQPLADHVVIRPAAAKSETAGGIVIPENAKEVPMRGHVLATGPGAVLPGIGSVPMTVAVGQEVLFGRYAGVEVTLDGEDVRIMREEDILGVLAPEVNHG